METGKKEFTSCCILRERERNEDGETQQLNNKLCFKRAVVCGKLRRMRLNEEHHDSERRQTFIIVFRA